MLQKVKKICNWLSHDFLGKLLFVIVIIILLWSKWAGSRYIIYHWCANKYVPGYLESLFSISSRLDIKGIILESAFKITWIFVTINYLRAALEDPGYIDRMNLEMPSSLLPEKLEKKCIKCNNLWKPPRAHHCKTCNKCILRMDHHCEWINNCVGAKNQKFFILFLIYSVLYSLVGIILGIMNLILWIMEYPLDPKGQAVFKDGWGTGNKIFLAICAVFFLLFTFDFLWEQGESVFKNQTTVETYKNMVGRPRKLIPSIEKVFGINRWTWLLPVTPELRVNALELLYYEIDVHEATTKKTKYDEDDFEKLPIYQKYFI